MSSQVREVAAAWLKRGQAHEAQNSPAALVEALRCYNEAIGHLRALPQREEAVRHDLGMAWMNLGNALQKQKEETGAPDAIHAYEQAIATLQSLPLAQDAGYRNSLGAAWMNRALALHRWGAGKKIDEAIKSHQRAIEVLQTLPIGEFLWFRFNLAAARMNLANALLDRRTADGLTASRHEARAALALLNEGDLEHADQIAAEIGLKARRVLCDALGHLLTANSTAQSVDALAAEASDAVDEGLALIRHWNQQAFFFRELAERFFYFGVQLYRLHQPQFLAEFILESLDPEPAGAKFATPAMHAMATDALNLARRGLDRPQFFSAENSADARRLQTWRDLQAASARLAELRPDVGPGAAT